MASSSFDGNWDNDKLVVGDLAKTVAAVHLVAFINESNKGDEEGLPPTNHWCCFLETYDKTSVRLDMMPGYGSDGLRGKIQIVSKEYAYTRNNVHVLSFDAVSGVTVQKIVDLIMSRGRQKYQFTPEWEGCRYWNLILIQDMVTAGYIPSGSSNQAEEAMLWYWVYPQGKEKRVLRKGTFRA
ncbi:hypothetical protein VTI74DRAFT_436 [Chaetomium olivicolor]